MPINPSTAYVPFRPAPAPTGINPSTAYVPFVPPPQIVSPAALAAGADRFYTGRTTNPSTRLPDLFERELNLPGPVAPDGQPMSIPNLSASVGPRWNPGTPGDPGFVPQGGLSRPDSESSGFWEFLRDVGSGMSAAGARGQGLFPALGVGLSHAARGSAQRREALSRQYASARKAALDEAKFRFDMYKYQNPPTAAASTSNTVRVRTPGGETRLVPIQEAIDKGLTPYDEETGGQPKNLGGVIVKADGSIDWEKTKLAQKMKLEQRRAGRASTQKKMTHTERLRYILAFDEDPITGKKFTEEQKEAVRLALAPGSGVTTEADFKRQYVLAAVRGFGSGPEAAEEADELWDMITGAETMEEVEAEETPSFMDRVQNMLRPAPKPVYGGSPPKPAYEGSLSTATPIESMSVEELDVLMSGDAVLSDEQRRKIEARLEALGL